MGEDILILERPTKRKIENKKNENRDTVNSPWALTPDYDIHIFNFRLLKHRLRDYTHVTHSYTHIILYYIILYNRVIDFFTDKTCVCVHFIEVQIISDFR